MPTPAAWRWQARCRPRHPLACRRCGPSGSRSACRRSWLPVPTRALRLRTLRRDRAEPRRRGAPQYQRAKRSLGTGTSKWRIGGRGSITARATTPAISSSTTTTKITGPIFKVGTAKRLRERNMGTARATYPGRRPSGNRRGMPRALLETAGGMGDIHGCILVMDASAPLSLPCTVTLVGLMGAGKSAIGKRLALKLGLPFVDADDEIERAAGCSIAEFFEKYGEADFRAGERRVIARLLDEPPHILSTGGGAYIHPETRALMRAKAVTVWLRAELDVLYERVRRRGHRPLLRQGDPKEVLGRLMSQRYPIYAEADIVVDSTAQPADRTTDQVIAALRAYLQKAKTPV